MLKKLPLIIFIALFAIDGFSQVNRFGDPEVINYPPEVTKGSVQNWSITQDPRGVIYVGNDEAGVLEYDGSEWRIIPISNNSTVRSLACSREGVVYVGAVGEFGYLTPDNTGNLTYLSLLSKLDSTVRFNDVWKTYATEDRILFHSQNMLFIYFPAEDSLATVPQPNRHALFGYYEHGKYWCGNFRDGLMELVNDTSIVVAKGGSHYKGKDIFGLTAYDDEHLIIGTSGFGLSIYNQLTGEVDTTFGSKELNLYLNENFLTYLLKVGDDRFAASTINGGLVLFSRTGELLEVITKENGLQDQLIYSIYQNPDSYPYPPVWAAMSIGIAKVNFQSPLRRYTEEDGFRGLIHTINSMNDRVYLGTANGLYGRTIKDGKYGFERISSFAREVWDMQNFTLADGSEVLITIGAEGTNLIYPNDTVADIDELLVGTVEDDERIFYGYSVHQDPFQPTRILIGLKSGIKGFLYENGAWSLEFTRDGLLDEVRSLAALENGKILFGSKLAGLGILEEMSDSASLRYFSTEDGLPTNDQNSVFQCGTELFIGTEDGVYRMLEENDSITFYNDSLLNSYLDEGENSILTVYKDPEGAIWISYENEHTGWNELMLTPTDSGTYSPVSKPFYSLENFSTDVLHSVTGDQVWFSKSNVLFNFNKKATYQDGSFNALIRKVIVNEDQIIYQGAYHKLLDNGQITIAHKQQTDQIPEISHSENNLRFIWTAPYFQREDRLEYSYYLKGFSKNWSEWGSDLYLDFTNLPHGNYTFNIKSRNIYRDESQVDSFSFVILRPWYLSFLAFFLYVVAAIAIVYMIIAIYTRRLKNENIRLEGIIQERTSEIRKQKEELTDSIEYASRIQRALLPAEQMLDKHGVDHFILFRPRDIVSGDFYWFGKNDGKVFIVAADCTGHGVPGAFMSMLGISFLDEIVIKSGISDTNLILDALRNHVITSLKQTGKSMEESTKDGMDLAMISIDQNTQKIQYSGAYNPLYVVRELSPDEKKKLSSGEELELERGSIHSDTHLLYQIKADLMPIGISEKDHDFNASLVDEPGGTIYLFSDGYVDQFGGPSGKKFMSKNFKKLLLDIQKYPMAQQQEKLNQTLERWMGDISQIDDVLVIGVRLG